MGCVVHVRADVRPWTVWKTRAAICDVLKRVRTGVVVLPLCNVVCADTRWPWCVCAVCCVVESAKAKEEARKKGKKSERTENKKMDKKAKKEKARIQKSAKKETQGRKLGTQWSELMWAKQ